ncbi:hypothetical protein [Pseudosulfitobacter pseudonitzschiae]|nr:hypothetical protein [Pseudosulfitobacter pseudonitzschiae]
MRNLLFITAYIALGGGNPNHMPVTEHISDWGVDGVTHIRRQI